VPHQPPELEGLLRAVRDDPGDEGSRLILADWLEERGGLRLLIDWRRWDGVEVLLTDLAFLEARAKAGRVFDLVTDLAEAVRHLPPGRPSGYILRLLEEALRRDAHFIARHPAALFQCLWNSCWWYDSPAAAAHYDPPESGWPPEGPPWHRPGPRVATLLESWRREKDRKAPGSPWLRSLRPPPFPLGGPQRAVMPVDTDRLRFLSLTFSPDGQYLFAWLGPTGVADPAVKALRVWDAWTGAEVGDRREVDFPYHPPSLSGDRRWRLECGAPGGGWGAPVRLCDAASGRTVASFEVHEDLNLREAAFSAEGRRVAAGGYGDEGGGEVVAWDVSSRRRIAQVYPDHSVWAVALSPDGKRIASGTSDGAVQLWEVAGGAQLATLRGHEDGVEAVTFAPDGRRLASGSHDGTVRVWDLDRRGAGPRLRGHPDHAQDLVFSTDGRRLVTRSENDTTWLWDAVTGAPVACLHRSSFVVLEGGSASRSVFADGQRVVSVAGEGGVWTAATGEAMGPPNPELRFVWSCKVLFSPDGRRVAVASGSRGGLKILETAGGAEVARLGDDRGLTCMAFSPDGERLACGSEGGTVRVWAVAGGIPLASLRGHDGLVSCVAFAPDGGRVCSGAADKTVRIWDITAGAQLACVRVDDVGVWSSGWSLEGGEWVVHAVHDVAFSADGALVLAQCEGKIQAWDSRGGACLRALEGTGDLKAIASGTPWPAFVRGPEVVVESADTGEAVAWLPCALGFVSGLKLTTHPAGRTWAGGVGPHLYLFTLEGGGCGAREALMGVEDQIR
jgi:uncharacterized protein (TIGR02996 family)